MKRIYIGFFLLSFSRIVFAQEVDFVPIDAVNSPYDERNPVLSPDGNTLYFTIANHPQNAGGRRDPGDIWYSTRVNDAWSKPTHAGYNLNDKNYNGVAGLSADGNTMFLLSHYSQSGEVKTQGLSVSKHSGSGWSKPQNITIPYFQNKSGALSGYISSDLSLFVFSAETYGSHGVEDIYLSRKKADGSWTEPRNLGGTINTQFQELSPSLSPDGRTLYYSSNGRKGSGSFDIYAANRLDDSWTSWSEPVNLGTGLNSAGRELFFRLNAEQGIATYTSTTDSDGYGDIKIYVPRDLPGNNPVAVDSATNVMASADSQPVSNKGNILTVHGKVSSSKSGKPVQAKIIFENTSQSLSASSDESGYSINVPPVESYTVKIEASGYISKLEQLDMKTLGANSLEMNFELQPAEKGARVNLKSVLFEQSTTNLLPGSFPELDMVVSFLQENPNVSIELGGHTDNRGLHSDNVRLSQERVEKVKEYLVSKGIDPKRITGKGYGGLKPVASNDAEETRKLNRRVEFIIKKI